MGIKHFINVQTDECANKRNFFNVLIEKKPNIPDLTTKKIGNFKILAYFKHHEYILLSKQFNNCRTEMSCRAVVTAQKIYTHIVVINIRLQRSKNQQCLDIFTVNVVDMCILVRLCIYMYTFIDNVFAIRYI